MPVFKPIILRFFEKVSYDEETECWLFSSDIQYNGYARIWDGSKPIYAHRFVYEYFIGTIPEGLQIDHLCQVKNCVNPEHLEAVSCEENNRRRPEVTSPYCRNGHKRTPFNVRHSRDGWKVCLDCKWENYLKHKPQKPAESLA